MGAGVASLLTLILSDELSTPIHCYAFAPPCCVSLDLAQRSRTLITTIVANDDVVPRLSYGSAEDLKLLVKKLSTQSKSNYERFFQLLSAGRTLGKFGDRISEWMNWKTNNDLTEWLKQNRTVSYTSRLQ